MSSSNSGGGKEAERQRGRRQNDTEMVIVPEVVQTIDGLGIRQYPPQRLAGAEQDCDASLVQRVVDCPKQQAR